MYTVNKATIDDLADLAEMDHVYHVEVVLTDRYEDIAPTVYAAAESAGRYVSSGQSSINGVHTFHLFPKN